MIEFRMMRLYLREVSIVEVSRILQWPRVLKYNDSPRPVTHSQQIPRAVKRYRGERVLIGHTELISLTQAIDIHPLHRRNRGGLKDNRFFLLDVISWGSCKGVKVQGLSVTPKGLKLKIRDLFLQDTDVIERASSNHELRRLILLLRSISHYFN